MHFYFSFCSFLSANVCLFVCNVWISVLRKHNVCVWMYLAMGWILSLYNYSQVCSTYVYSFIYLLSVFFVHNSYYKFSNSNVRGNNLWFVVSYVCSKCSKYHSHTFCFRKITFLYGVKTMQIENFHDLCDTVLKKVTIKKGFAELIEESIL